MAWADALAISALRNSSGSIERPLELMAHVLGAEHVWLARLEGREASVAVWPQLSVDECERISRELRDAYAAFLSRQDEESLATPVHYRNSAGAAFDSRVDDILTHVALHGSYHRGQVALALRQDGSVPEPTDYIAFARGSPAATRVPNDSR
jgi:uncharacterized damage-inducible protein DinB